MDPAVFVPAIVFGAAVAIIWIVMIYMSRNRRVFFEAVRSAFERGVELSPEMIKTLGAPRATKYADIKWGIIWIAVAGAFLVLGWAGSMSEEAWEMMWMCAGIAAFPGFVGLALLGYGLVMLRNKDE